MRWTIEGFSQKRLIEIGLDIMDAVILRFTADFYLSGKMQKITAEDGEYFWLCYSHVLAELPILGIEKRQFSNRIERLVDTGILKKRIERSGMGTRAYIRFDEDLFAALVCDEDYIKKEKTVTPADEVLAKAERKEGRDAFFNYYNLKALELRGEKVPPLWGAKEASLVKADTAQLGLGELIRCMKLFFSDSVQEVKEFTRTKNKAGYSYAVFHGSLAKLSISPERIPEEPCAICGGWKHRPGCEVLNQAEAKRHTEKETEVATLKEEVAGIDFTKMFEQASGKKVLPNIV